ncbi:MAG TPA: hypothetical protein VGM90_02895 [Kofleriaceae bacterium]
MVLEQGDVQFFWRPMVQAAAANTYTLGVQQFFFVMSPAGRELHRRLRVGKKRMPATSKERFWAKVERVGSMQRVLGDALESESYATKTRGERYQPGARPVAMGQYELVKGEHHVKLVYDVEPFDFVDAPDELKMPEHGEHRVLWKRAPGGTSRAVWTPEGDIATLDEKGAQIVLIGPSQSERADD